MIFHGDCLIQMKTLPDNSIDAIVTDPPYGLSFMGKKWDYDVPSVEIWKEALRILKPGGHLLSFGGTRTYHRMAVNIEDAGFEIRDQLQWLYGSGFPKSHNIKEGDFKGFGTALKPANEPICLARKPLEKGLTVAQNVMKWGTGALNIDGCRIETDWANDPNKRGYQGTNYVGGNPFAKDQHNQDKAVKRIMPTQGRWPSNIILDEQAAFDLDEQSGQSVSRPHKNKISGGCSTFNTSEGPAFSPHDDSGGASRFFYVAKASKREKNAGLEGMPLVKIQDRADGTKRKLVAQAESPKNPNLPRANHHPTVKPIKLMEYLCKLIVPPNGVILDPFMGSGSTGVSAKNLGFDFIGIEMNEEYLEIAKKRIG